MKRIVQSLICQLLVLAIGGPAVGQLASELLERAIYTEETLGDPSAAIEIYRQILDDAESARPQVAQAQYRLGICYLKSGRDEEAAAAFQKVIDEFADQAELVALARESLPGLPVGPVLEREPWVDGELLRLDLRLAAGKQIGTVFVSTDAEEIDGQAAWHLQLRKFVFLGRNNQGISRVYAARGDFSPIRSLFKHTAIGEAEGTYGPRHVEIRSKNVDEARQVQLEGTVYDNEQAWHLFRRLPLAPGYTTTTSIIPTFAGTQMKLDLEVTETETISVPAGEFESYRLEVPELKQTYWISTDENRYLVRFEAEGVVGELAWIGRRDHDEPLPYEDEELGFAVESPGDWYQYAPPGGRPGSSTLLLLDPDADVRGTLEIDSIPEGRSWTVQARAESELEGCKERFEEYALRDGSWAERNIAGRTAISFVGDYKENGTEMVQYRAYILSDELSGEFIFKVAADRFEEYEATLDSIVESYQLR